MALKNQALTITYQAWNTSTNLGAIGDAANHTLRAVGDGAEYTPSGTPLEVDGTNLKGIYKLALIASETNYNFFTVGGVSSTANVVILPVPIATERGVLPNATAGAAGGLFIAGTNAATTANITGNLTGNVTGSVGSVTGGVTLAAGAFGFASIAPDVSAILFRANLVSAGVTTPVSADQYSVSGVYPAGSGIPYYVGKTNGLILWYTTSTTIWTISTVLGTNGAAYWTTAAASTAVGPYTLQGSAIGTPVLTPHGNSVWSAFQPEISIPTPAQNATAVWTDPTASSDFSSVGSAGALFKTLTPPTAVVDSGTVIASPAPQTTGGTTTFSATGNLHSTTGADYSPAADSTGGVSVFWQTGSNQGSKWPVKICNRTTPGGVPTYAFTTNAMGAVPVATTDTFLLV